MNMRHLRFIAGMLVLILVTAGADCVRAAGPADAIPLPTMGGKQFWADELFFQQWRIQQNVLTGHYRLLDGNDFRHASGSYDECLAALEQIKRERNLPPMQGKAVIVLHGLGADRTHMDVMAKYLRDHGGYTVFNVTYPSTQRDIAANAQSLGHIIEHLDGIEEINFVAHSLGNIVVRRWLADQTDAASGRRPDGRIKRFVMLAPPNHGSLLAVALGDNKVYRVVTGQTGQQLGRDWQQMEGKLATPTCEFGILAGGRGDKHGYNLLLPGDNDGIVSVETTRLAGARDFRRPARPASPHHVQRQGPGVHVAILAEGLLRLRAGEGDERRRRNSEFGRRNSGEPPPAAPSDFRLPTSEFVQPPSPSPVPLFSRRRRGLWHRADRRGHLRSRAGRSPVRWRITLAAPRPWTPGTSPSWRPASRSPYGSWACRSISTAARARSRGRPAAGASGSARRRACRWSSSTSASPPARPSNSSPPPA